MSNLRFSSMVSPRACTISLLWASLACITGLARAEERLAPPQVAAATAEAIRDLREQIERTSITPEVTVGDFLRKSGATDQLVRAIERAEIIGGPRWVDADTCQVQLEISGARVAHLLEQAAASHPRDLPIGPSRLARETENWRNRTFGGVGTGTAFVRVAKVRGSAAPGWGAVAEADRQKALANARAEAIARVLDSVKPIHLTGSKTVADALAIPAVRTAIHDWLDNRPVTRVDYRRDLDLELTMAGTPSGLFEVLRRSLSEHPDFALPKNEAGWQEIREDFERRMAPATGRGSVPLPAGGGPNGSPRVRVLVARPATAPDWVARVFDAEGTADPGKSKLKAAREAESQARKALAVRINALPWVKGGTLGDSAQLDARVREAISQSIDGARATTDYNARKGVSVKLHLELRDLWAALHAID